MKTGAAEKVFTPSPFFFFFFSPVKNDPAIFFDKFGRNLVFSIGISCQIVTTTYVQTSFFYT